MQVSQLLTIAAAHCVQLGFCQLVRIILQPLAERKQYLPPSRVAEMTRSLLLVSSCAQSIALILACMQVQVKAPQKLYVGSRNLASDYLEALTVCL